jgi:hypothetical protein
MRRGSIFHLFFRTLYGRSTRTTSATAMRMNKYQFEVGTQTVTGTLGWNANGSLGSLVRGAQRHSGPGIQDAQ